MQKIEYDGKTEIDNKMSISLNKSARFYRVIVRAYSIIKKNARLFIGIAIGILIAALFSFFYRKKERQRVHRHYEKMLIAQQAELIETNRNTALVNEMSHVVNQMHDELSHHTKRMLSDETIARLAALSYSFTPYLHVEGDSISSKKLSPERGQLLLIISGMNIDSGSLEKLMQQMIFSSANLRNADLQNAYLKGANLQGADLREANLEGVNLNEADLKWADLWGANLKQASLLTADLKSAELSWSNLNGAGLRGAKLNKAILKSAQLRKTDLRGAIIQRADLSGALLTGANLEGADMLSALLYRTNLNAANLSYANLTTVTWAEANLTEADLTGSVVTQENWLTLLNEWKVTGAADIATRYQLVADADSLTLVPQYRLTNRDK